MGRARGLSQAAASFCLSCRDISSGGLTHGQQFIEAPSFLPRLWSKGGPGVLQHSLFPSQPATGGGHLFSSVKRTDWSLALCQSSVLTVRSRAIRGAANSKDARDSHPENPFAYIPAVISPLGRTGCNVSDRRSVTGVERGKNNKLLGLQKQRFLGQKDAVTT